MIARAALPRVALVVDLRGPDEAQNRSWPNKRSANVAALKRSAM